MLRKYASDLRLRNATSHRQEAERVYRKFLALPGSEHIAEAFAVEVLLREIARRRPTRILEIGAGIGTTTYAILSAINTGNPDLRPEFVTTEDHDFCLEQLEKNLAGIEGYRLIPNVDELCSSSIDGGFDLVLLDGGARNLDVGSLVSRRATVLVEGDRGAQRQALERQLDGRSWISSDVRTLQQRKPRSDPTSEGDAAPSYVGGCTLYFVGPTLADRLTYWRHRLKTAAVYRARRAQAAARR